MQLTTGVVINLPIMIGPQLKQQCKVYLMFFAVNCSTLLKYTASTYWKDSRYGVSHTTPLGATLSYK